MITIYIPHYSVKINWNHKRISFFYSSLVFSLFTFLFLQMLSLAYKCLKKTNTILSRSIGIDSRELRSKYLHYFEQNGHTVVPGSSLIPKNDDSLLFVNAGMVQFKQVFLGTETRYTNLYSHAILWKYV